VFGSVFTTGSEVWVAWRREHTFGLDATARVQALEAARGDEPDDSADGEAA
jgi:spermidine/putrescine transport system ATP-binding protein